MSPVELSPEQVQEIEQLTEKLRLVRLELAKKNQIVAKLQRQLDDVPNRAEMAQYQRRFLELYNQGNSNTLNQIRVFQLNQCCSCGKAQGNQTILYVV